MALTRDESRTALLLFADEVAEGVLDPAALIGPELEAAVAVHRIPSRLGRRLQVRAAQAGSLDFERAVARPQRAAREALLGAAAPGPPRVLLRLGPIGAGPIDGLMETHGMLQAFGVPYALELDAAAQEAGPERLALAGVLADDGVSLAVPVDGPREGAAALGIEPWLATVDGGADAKLLRDAAAPTEVVTSDVTAFAGIGFHPGPRWRGGIVHLPTAPPLQGDAAAAAAVVGRLLDARTRVWVPVVLDWRAEHAAGLGALRALVGLLARTATGRPWSELRAAVRLTQALA